MLREHSGESFYETYNGVCSQVAMLKESHTMPLTSLTNSLHMESLSGFVMPLEGLVQHGTLPDSEPKMVSSKGIQAIS